MAASKYLDELKAIAANRGNYDKQGGQLAVDAAIATVQAERQRGVAQSHAHELFKRAAIPPRFSTRTLSNFKPLCDKSAKALAVASNYAENFTEVLKSGQSMIFVGGVGAGKTHLATGIAHEVINSGRSALFSTVLGAVRTVKETYRRDSEKTETQAIMDLVKPDLLVLDEVGVQFGSDAEKLILFEIINGRYEHMKPTILLSNLNIKGLTEYLGERIIDRLREGDGKHVTFDWGSYRRNT